MRVIFRNSELLDIDEPPTIVPSMLYLFDGKTPRIVRKPNDIEMQIIIYHMWDYINIYMFDDDIEFGNVRYINSKWFVKNDEFDEIMNLLKMPI